MCEQSPYLRNLNIMILRLVVPIFSLQHFPPHLGNFPRSSWWQVFSYLPFLAFFFYFAVLFCERSYYCRVLCIFLSSQSEQQMCEVKRCHFPFTDRKSGPGSVRSFRCAGSEGLVSLVLSLRMGIAVSSHWWALCWMTIVLLHVRSSGASYRAVTVQLGE